MATSKVTRRAILKLAGSAMLGSILSACAPKVVEKVVERTVEVQVEKPVEVAVTAAPKTGSVQHYIFDYSKPTTEAYQTRAKTFETMMPGVKADVISVPWSELWTKASLAYAAGSPPDLIEWDYPSYPLFKKGQLLDLEPYIEADAELQDPAKYEQAWFEDYALDAQKHHYALPDFITGYFIMLNMDMFDKAGIPYPADDWSFEDFVTIAKELTIANGDQVSQYGCCWGEWWADWAFMSTIWAFGGEWAVPRVEPTEVRVDAPETIAALQWLQDLVWKEKVGPQSGVGDTELGGPYESQLAAMVGYGDWWIPAVSKLGFKWDLHLLPKGLGGQVSPRWEWGTSISSGSKNKDLAWAYLRFIVGEAGQRIMAATSPGVPFSKAVAKSDMFMKPDWAPEHLSVRWDTLKDSRPADVLHDNWTTMLLEVLRPVIIDPIRIGEKTAQQSLTEGAARLREVLFGGV